MSLSEIISMLFRDVWRPKQALGASGETASAIIALVGDAILDETRNG
jgi:hypothetical protein